MSSTIQFYHFDTAQRDNLADDPFQCQLTLSNPLRQVKKIYLKSAEIPVGYFNIRTTQYFEFATSFSNFYEVFDPDTLTTFRYRPTWSNSYHAPEDEDNIIYYTATGYVGGENGPTDEQRDILVMSIAVVPGNYTMDSLITYINNAIGRTIAHYSIIANYSAILSTVRVSDTGQFPVGYLQFTSSDEIVWILPTELSYKYLGFTSYQNNQPLKQTSTPGTKHMVQSLRLWNMYPDLGFYIHLENVPHTNSHFINNLASFKVPITSGYQSIEYNADNAKFAQYIENTDGNYILDKIKLKVYDRNNNLLINGFDWTFTLGVEHCYNISSMSNTIQFYHFDTAQRDNLVDDPFQCQFTLTNPLRRVKKIYLKSAEIPIGVFTIRENQYFEYSSSHLPPGSGYYSVFVNLATYDYRPTFTDNYNLSEDLDSFYTYTTLSGVSPQDTKIYRVSIAITPGNYTITTLLSYINSKLQKMFTLFRTNFLAITAYTEPPSFVLSTITVSDTGVFPVGYVKASYNSKYIYIWNNEFNYKYLGFTVVKDGGTKSQNNKDTLAQYMNALRPWNMYNDLCFSLHLENIPQTNTHFKNNSASYKIPITSGYQAIEYNADNANFAQYIENTDINYILDKIKFKVYDRNNNLLNNNGYNWTFTLGIEYFN